jgi:hypothetical protein
MGCIQTKENPDKYKIHIARRTFVNFDKYDTSMKNILMTRISPTHKNT